jgi:hypothetical protein
VNGAWYVATWQLWFGVMLFLAAAGLFIAIWRDTGGKRRMHCRVCGKRTAHHRIGVQSFGRHGSLELWNCSECGGTRSEMTRG